VQCDGSVLKKVDELSVLVPLLEEAVRARVAIERHLAQNVTRTDAPVKVRLDGKPSLSSERDHL